MARNRCRGDAADVAQVTRFVVTGAGNPGDTITFTISNKTVVVTVPAAPTVATVGTTCSTVLGNSTITEFEEVSWTDDGAGNVYGTSATPGVPFTVTVSVSGAVTVTGPTLVTASSGHQHWDDPTNWSLGHVPTNTEDVDIMELSTSLLYGIEQSGVTLNSLNLHSTFTGQLGLPSQQGDYFEYRDQYLAISATTITVGAGSGSGSSLIKIDTGANSTTILCLSTSTAGLQGSPAFWWKGTGVANAVTVNRGVMGIAFGPGEVATLPTLNIGSQGSPTDAQVYVGVGTTLTTVNMNSGVVNCDANLTTVTMNGGTLTLTNTALAVTTATIKSGTLYFNGTGTITNMTLGKGALLDSSQDPRTSKTITNLTCDPGCGIKNGNKTATFTNGVILNGTIDDVSPHEFGSLITITVA